MIDRQTVYGHYSVYDLKRLAGIRAYYRNGRSSGERKRFNCVFLMADTETSKGVDTDEYGHSINHVCAWSVAMRYEARNVFCLYGRKPSELCTFLEAVHNSMPGTHTIIYFHQLAFDWQFLRKFTFKAWGFPCNQLNTKTHYPINIEFKNGIIFRDSLILSQVSLAKWGEQMGAEHAKAVGKWNYDKVRNQNTPLTDDELLYIYNDVLCGVECLDELCKRLNKRPYTMPWTATGIVRELTRKNAKPNNGHAKFVKTAFEFEDYLQCEKTYHGAFTHANRFKVNEVQYGNISCYDFASSYPATMCMEKFPMEKFTHCPDTSIEGILRYSEDYAFLLKLIAIDVKMRDHHNPMPYLQASKCLRTVNAVIDNGRILEADMIVILITEIDLKILNEQYDFSSHLCKDVMFAKKNYLPRWFTDEVFELYRQKCQLKTGDKTEYALSKSRVNSLYGMCVQRLFKQSIEERYTDNEFITVLPDDPKDVYYREIKKRGHVLPYQIGVWVTCYAVANLFRLGKCFNTWLYSDTDSVYGIGVIPDKLDEYNRKALEKLQANGYDVITIEGRNYQLGEAALDGTYTEFITVGSKRYAKRDTSGCLSITVAGVPKKGVACLQNDINRFRKGLIFDGKTTGKLAHFYDYVEDIYTDSNGNEVGDYIDLEPCDYLLDDILSVDDILYEYIEVPNYD